MVVSMSGFGALLTLSVAVCLSLRCVDATDGLWVGFYHRSCQSAEKIIFNSLYQSYKKDQKIAPGILRIAFHDCFVRGCDCSIMLDGPTSEKTSVANVFNSQTYEALDSAKRAVENACPGVVSCADVLQFAARDSVILSGGDGWAVPAGRRDGRVSKIEEVTTLPSPFANISTLIKLFEKKGLTADQMVVLSGAHTIGTSTCFTFDNRIQTPTPDPTLKRAFALSLKRQCPTPRLFSTRVAMDSTPHLFDTRYFHDVVRGRALMSSDQALMEDHGTRQSVYENLNPHVFHRAFASAMVAMSKIEVLTGLQGEIRRQMRVVNS